MSTVLGIVLMLHSLVRWLVVLVAAAALIKFAVGWLQRQTWASMDRGLSAGFAGLMDLQALLGLVYLFGTALALGQGWPRFRLEHAVAMILAVAAAHVFPRLKAASDAQRFRNALVGIVVALLLVVVGVATLPQGWFG